MQQISQPLTNVQLEILKAFSFQLDPEELDDFRSVIAQFFAKRAMELADKTWDEKGWTQEYENEILNTKLRKAKKS